MNTNSTQVFWTKAARLLQLQGMWLCIPKTLVVQELDDIRLPLFDSNQYIVRPSYYDEDGKLTKAGFYKSIIVQNLQECIDTYSHEWYSMFSRDGNKPQAIIVQEFIKWDLWGVYFTKNPTNIYEPGLYEVSTEYEWITKGFSGEKEVLHKNVEQELYALWDLLEKMFWCPQDIEFVVQGKAIYLLQSRDITTWDLGVAGNYTKTWWYRNIDNGEFPEIKVFTYSFLQHIIDCILISSTSLFWKRIILSKEISLPYFWKFLALYKHYLIKKNLYSFLRNMLFWQKLDTAFLKQYLISNIYSLDILSQENISKRFCSIALPYKTNLTTRLFLKTLELKHLAFIELWKCRKSIQKKNTYWANIHYLTIDEFCKNTKSENHVLIQKRKKIPSNYRNDASIYIKNSAILSRSSQSLDTSVICSWTMQWVVWNTQDIEAGKATILKTENLDFQIYDCIDRLQWVIAKDGKILSHTAIVLRELGIAATIDSSLYTRVQRWKKVHVNI